jgi:hypothetical protein
MIEQRSKIKCQSCIVWLLMLNQSVATFFFWRGNGGQWLEVTIPLHVLYNEKYRGSLLEPSKSPKSSSSPSTTIRPLLIYQVTRCKFFVD